MIFNWSVLTCSQSNIFVSYRKPLGWRNLPIRQTLIRKTQKLFSSKQIWCRYENVLFSSILSPPKLEVQKLIFSKYFSTDFLFTFFKIFLNLVLIRIFKKQKENHFGDCEEKSFNRRDDFQLI